MNTVLIRLLYVFAMNGRRSVNQMEFMPIQALVIISMQIIFVLDLPLFEQWSVRGTFLIL